MPTTTATSEIFIHRHCMQHLLHEAINQQHNHCYGLLTGGGNIVKNCFPVTKKLQSTSKLIPKESLFGVYLATDNNGIVEPEMMLQIKTIWQQLHSQTPSFYLILYLDHKGRIDARMYSDATLHTAITLNMLEDSETTSTQ